MKKEAYILINEYLLQANDFDHSPEKRHRQNSFIAGLIARMRQRYTSGQSDNLLSYYYLLSKVKNCRAQENDLYSS